VHRVERDTIGSVGLPKPWRKEGKKPMKIDKPHDGRKGESASSPGKENTKCPGHLRSLEAGEGPSEKPGAEIVGPHHIKESI
jgi:hypothetical protein